LQADIITIGDELLIGQVVDTNSAFIASELNSVGISVHKIHSVGDSEIDMIKALDESIQESELVILTGGLGPTNDDITKKVLAKYFETGMVIHKDSLDNIKMILSARGVELSERNINQAMIPDNCEVLTNKHGSAPGMIFRKKDRIIVSLPGVPYEMKTIVQEELLSFLSREYSLPVIMHKTILTVGTAESILADLLNDWEKKLPTTIKLAYLPGIGILRLRLSATGENKANTKTLLDEKAVELIGIIGEKNVFGFDNDQLPSVIGKLLINKRASLSIAESCTGGNISHMVTSIPGSSEYFIGSVTAYSNEIKTSILGVNEEIILEHGAVSKQVVEQMALGVRERFKTDYAIATSGIAGPDGGTKEKPVGTTWIAVAGPKKLVSKKFMLGEHRERNIIKASLFALNMLRRTMD